MGTAFYSTGSTNWKAGKSCQGLNWGYWRKGHVWSTDDLSRGGTVSIYFGRAWWFMIHKNICNGIPRQRGQGVSAWLSWRVDILKGRIRTVISNIQTVRI
jgi:hypothetical protein